MSVHWFEGEVDGNTSHGSGFCNPTCPYWEDGHSGQVDTQARIDRENQEFFKEIEKDL